MGWGGAGWGKHNGDWVEWGVGGGAGIEPIRDSKGRVVVGGNLKGETKRGTFCRWTANRRSCSSGSGPSGESAEQSAGLSVQGLEAGVEILGQRD